jgi:hypothetical protein
MDMVIDICWPLQPEPEHGDKKSRVVFPAW